MNKTALHEPKSRSRWGTAGPALALLGVFILCVGLYTRHNDFPLFYHPDEDRKVEYVASGRTSFYHPMLMLTVTRRIARDLEVHKDPDAALRIGRTVTAVFAALAVVAWMSIAWLQGGTAAGIVVGLICALSPFLLLHAHYFKEDPGLLMGLGATLLTLALYLRRPLISRAGTLGLACGLAVSAKYIGAVTILPALAALLLVPRTGAPARVKRISVYCGALLIALAVINNQAIRHPLDFLQGLNYEITHVQNSHSGLRAAGFGAGYLDILPQAATWPILVLAAVYAVLFAISWRRRSATEWMMFAFPIVYLLLMDISRVHLPRYILPVAMGLHYWAGMGLVEWTQRTRGPRVVRLSLGMLVFAGVLAGMAIRDGLLLRDFAHDNREALALWVAQHLPPHAFVLAEKNTGLNQYRTDVADVDIPCRITPAAWSADDAGGSLQAAREQGYTHIAVCEIRYGRLFDPQQVPTADHSEIYVQRLAFYRELFADGELVWSAEGSDFPGSFNNPTVHLYRIVDESISTATADIH